MKPLISYYGGKQKLVSKLIPLIPDHSIYVEPFCGGASLFFAKPRKPVSNQDKYIEVLNDTNGELVNMYRIAQSRKDEFLKKLSEFPYSERIHKHFKSKPELDDLEKAVGFYIRIMMSFTKRLDAGFAFSKMMNHVKIYSNHLNRLPDVIDRLKNTYIFDRCALDIIKRFDSEETFFYCDPPYPGSDQGHYKGYTQQDFQDLVDLLLTCKGSFFLSCYENAAVPQDWEKFEFKAVNSSSNTRKGGHRQARTECVWRKLNKTV